jgi:hypothetical protein
LLRPDSPPDENPELIPRVVEDAVLYDDLAPWPVAADGLESSLVRRGSIAIGGNAGSWVAEISSPGSVAFLAGVPGDLTGDDGVTAEDIDVLLDAVRRGSTVGSYDLNNDETVDVTDVAHLVQTILGTNFGDANLDGQVSVTDLNELRIHWLATDCVGWSTGDLTGDGKVNAADLNVLGINWLSGVALVASQPGVRVPRTPLAIAAPRPAVIIDAVLGDKINVNSWSYVAVENSSNSLDVSRAGHADHMAELGVTETAYSKRFRGQVEQRRRRVNGSSQVNVENEQFELLDDLFARIGKHKIA